MIRKYEVSAYVSGTICVVVEIDEEAERLAYAEWCEGLDAGFLQRYGMPTFEDYVSDSINTKAWEVRNTGMVDIYDILHEEIKEVTDDD